MELRAMSRRSFTAANIFPRAATGHKNAIHHGARKFLPQRQQTLWVFTTVLEYRSREFSCGQGLVKRRAHCTKRSSVTFLVAPK
jgi:hypothetical protein